MSILTRGIPDLFRSGPTLHCLVSPSAAGRNWFVAKGNSVPPPERVMAMVDTGSAVSVLGAGVVQALGLIPVGDVSIETPSTRQPILVRQYEVDITLPNGEFVYDLLAVEAPFGGQDLQVLIGRDILMHGVLVYLGTENQFTLGF